MQEGRRWRACRRLIAIVSLIAAPAVVEAGLGDCSQPVSSGPLPTASDCLFILRASVGSEICEPPCVCDPDQTNTTSATDALLCLKKVVGQSVLLRCPCPGMTTSTTTSISATTTSTVTTVSTTTTTIASVTTTLPSTTTTTTTTLPPDPRCPDEARTVVYARFGATCTTNSDCAIGECDAGAGRCRTPTSVELGWTGLAHDDDLNDGVVVATRLACPGPAAPGCGQCAVRGLDPAPGNCRCSGDNRTICDEPFVADDDDCGGAVCDCYFGPPLPLNTGNRPRCVVDRFARDVSGTTDVDTGEWHGAVDLRAVTYLGENLFVPCPYCDGDTTPGDGARDGVCVYGKDDGQACDAGAINRTFPRLSAAPGGGAYSLDCFSDGGKNVSGTGMKMSLDPSTGASTLGSEVLCGIPSPPINLVESCPCGVCSDDASDGSPCSSNADCAACQTNADCAEGGVGGVCDASGRCECVRRANLEPFPNECSGEGRCIDVGSADGVGECEEGPVDHYCDGIVRSSGDGFIQCNSNADCTAGVITIDSGSNCTLAKMRACFLDTIAATGAADPRSPVVAAPFCLPPTGSNGLNSAIGMPGPARVMVQLETTLFCPGDPGTVYQPGVGGCP